MHFLNDLLLILSAPRGTLSTDDHLGGKPAPDDARVVGQMNQTSPQCLALVRAMTLIADLEAITQDMDIIVGVAYPQAVLNRMAVSGDNRRKIDAVLVIMAEIAREIFPREVECFNQRYYIDLQGRLLASEIIDNRSSL